MTQMPKPKNLFAAEEHEDAAARRELSATRSTVLVRFGVGLILLAVAVAIWLRLGSNRGPEPVALSGSIAISPVVNATGRRESAWVEYGLMEMIAETVSRTAGY